MTEGVFKPQGELMTAAADNSNVAACAGQATYQLPDGRKQTFPGIHVALDHHWTGNHHSLIFSRDAAKRLVIVINAALSQPE